MGMSMACGTPPDRKEMSSLLRAAIDRGVNFFDTAEVYGPFINEELLDGALSPVRDSVVIATKFGFNIGGPGDVELTTIELAYINSAVARMILQGDRYPKRCRSLSTDNDRAAKDRLCCSA